MRANMEGLQTSPVCTQYNGVMKSPLHLKSVSLVLLGSVIVSISTNSRAADNVPDQSVAVIRGGDTSQRAQDKSVVVMRPESGSFMRVTTRLADEAQAREERAAAEQARETSQQISEALRSAAQAAVTVRDRPPEYYAVGVSPWKRGTPRPTQGRRHSVRPAEPGA